MADLTITAASVLKGTGAVTAAGVAGATITAGVPLYIDTANGNVLKPADANVTLLTATVAGIALHASLTGQPIVYQTAGVIAIGATVVLGMPYCVSIAVGLIRPISDVASTEFLSIIGIATSVTDITLGIVNPTAAIASDIT